MFLFFSLEVGGRGQVVFCNVRCPFSPSDLFCVPLGVTKSHTSEDQNTAGDVWRCGDGDGIPEHFREHL